MSAHTLRRASDGERKPAQAAEAPPACWGVHAPPQLLPSSLWGGEGCECWMSLLTSFPTPKLLGSLVTHLLTSPCSSPYPHLFPSHTMNRALSLISQRLDGRQGCHVAPTSSRLEAPRHKGIFCRKGKLKAALSTVTVGGMHWPHPAVEVPLGHLFSVPICPRVSGAQFLLFYCLTSTTFR